MQMAVEMPVEQNISSTSEELKSNDTTSVVASGTGTPDMSQSLVLGYFWVTTRLKIKSNKFIIILP